MNKKIIFLDVDGTLVNENGIVPESAKVAVKKARKNGHYVFLCTGRSKAEIYEDIMEIGFDGIIAAAGGYIELGDKVLFPTLELKKEKTSYNHFKHWFLC